MRIARIVLPGCAYHLTHRGNRRAPVFFEAADREYYLHWLLRDAQRWELEIWAYCLMTNHIHLVVTPHAQRSLARVMGRSQSRYAKRINRRYGWSGHLWEDRFHSSLLDERHFPNAVRYVELNPVRAGLVWTAEDYRWSSASAHCRGTADRLVSEAPPGLVAVGEWSCWLSAGIPSSEAEFLRRNTYAGRPSAEPDFLRRLEQRLGWSLAVKPRGRPKRNSPKETVTVPNYPFTVISDGH